MFKFPFGLPNGDMTGSLFQGHGFSQITFFVFVLVLFPINIPLIRSIRRCARGGR